MKLFDKAVPLLIAFLVGAILGMLISWAQVDSARERAYDQRLEELIDELKGVDNA